jgi:cyclopropane fatty-acyl-phospholipid synthase-like methyltransferase
MKQFSPSCVRNQAPILAVLQAVLPATGTVLEIGSGTGQHAVYFASRLPRLIWQPTDLPENFPSIRAWAAEAGLPNLPDPIELDLLAPDRAQPPTQAVVCINTIHIVAWSCVENLFGYVGRVLPAGGVFYVYGPYRYADRPLEPSNEAFDRWLKARDAASGVRDFAAVDALARQNSLLLAGDQAMPANNRSIWWIKQ